jgi:predicted DNA-binding protein
MIISIRGYYFFREDSMTKTITIRVNTDALDKVRAISKEQDRSINYIINKIILEYLQGGKVNG